MLRPTFSGFQVAKRGLSASQKLLDVTGQNISNINTDGYTRQRIDLYSIAHSSGNVQYGDLVGGIGRGVGDLGASQIRDPFLDLRYRAEASKVGKQDVMNDALSDLEAIFDEISKNGLDSQFSDFISQLQALSQTPSDPVIEGVVKTSASMITQLFNHYAKQIDTISGQQTTYLEDSVNDVNSLLSGIAELNKQIREANIHGDKALELNDRRNSMIDELSIYMNVEIVRTSEDIGNGREVENLSIKLKDNDMVLVNGREAAKLKCDDSDMAANNNMKVVVEKSIDANFANGTDLTNVLTQGEVSGYLAFLNNEAEFTDNTSFSTDERGIKYYKGMLNQVANKFATEFNKANTTTDADGNIIEKPLFGTSDGSTEITAANIKITDAWKNSKESYIVNSKVEGSGNDNTAANDNILNMIAILDSQFVFTNDVTGGGNNFLFKGTIQECFSHASTTLSLQIKNSSELFEGYGQTLLTIDTARASISSVSLDEEGINLLAYNKSYSAAARFMTTLDEALDTLINGTGRVGL